MLYGSLNFLVAAGAVVFFAWFVSRGVRRSDLVKEFKQITEGGIWFLAVALLLYMLLGTFGEETFIRPFR